MNKNTQVSVLRLKLTNGTISAVLRNGEVSLPDPFSPTGLMSETRLSSSSEYLPFLMLRQCGTGRLFLIFLLRSNHDMAIVWNYSPHLAYEGQNSLRASALASYLQCMECTIDKNWEFYVDSRFPHWSNAISQWKRRTSDGGASIVSEHQITSIAQAAELPCIFLDTVAHLENNWNSDPQLFLDTALAEQPNHTAAAVRAFFDELDHGLDAPVLSVSGLKPLLDSESTSRGHTWFYKLLKSLRLALARDCVFQFTGQYFAWSPISGSWIAATQQLIVQCSLAGRTFRVFRYADRCGEFLEINGYGYLGTSTVFLCPWLPGQACGPSGTPNYSSWFHVSVLGPRVWPSILRLVRNCPRLIRSEQRSLAANCSSKNLGHVIWNDMNGTLAWCSAQTKIDASAIPSILQPAAAHNSYSAMPNDKLYLDFVQHQFKSPSVIQCEGITDHDTTIRWSSRTPAVLPYHLIFSEERRDAIKSFLERYSDRKAIPPSLQTARPDDVTVLINIRGGNKVWTNLSTCIASALDLLASQGRTPILVYEASSKDKALVDKAEDAARQQQVEFHSLYDLTAYGLHAAVDICSVVVAPVGSALVIPTWIMNKRCVVHGDPEHMIQLAWWPLVVPSLAGEIAHSLHPVPLSSITADNPAKLYSDYRISPSVFAETLLSAIET